MTFEEMQADFRATRPPVPSLPLTGAINYAAAAVASPFVAPDDRNLLMFACFWAIMPVGALLSKLRGEALVHNRTNPLNRLSELARVMVLTTWAIHIPVWLRAPDLFPLTVGIAFALHWVVFSWSMGNRIGVVHLALRTTLVLAAWLLFPANRVGAVCAGIAIAYLVSVVQLSRRPA